MNRTLQPEIQELVQFNILPPVRTVMPNGVPLTIINAGEQDVVRVDILFGGGRWQQSQKLQALFANRMLREGSRKYTAAEIAEKLDYYGAWLELSSSAEYAYITLYSLNKYFAETLDVLESIIKEPLFPDIRHQSASKISSEQSDQYPEFQIVRMCPHNSSCTQLYCTLHRIFSLYEKTFLGYANKWKIFLDRHLLMISKMCRTESGFYTVGNLVRHFTGKVNIAISRMIICIIKLA